MSTSFQQDGLRDGEHLREWMHERFIARLAEQRAPWFLTRGSLMARVTQRLQWIDSRMSAALSFAEPLEKQPQASGELQQ